MICHQLTTLLGYQCHPLTDDGSVVLVDTSFTFQDGDFVPVYVQHIAGQVRFFDAGETILHLIGRGVDVSAPGKIKFLKTIAEKNGTVINTSGEIEVYESESNASNAFAKYLSTLLNVVAWETEHQGVSTEIDTFVEEVSMYFKAAYPSQIQSPSPEYLGVSGHKYKFDFIHGDSAVLAVTPHHASISSAIKKLVDLNQVSVNSNLNTLIVIEDRHDSKAAENETKVLTAISKVLQMSVLEKQATVSSSLN
jgi:Domain of unknown function DUF1828